MSKYNQINKLEITLGITLKKAFSKNNICSNCFFIDEYHEIIILKLEGIKLDLIDLNIIQEFPWLRTLYLRNCSIKEIPICLFEHPNLEYLDLSSNSISFIPDLRKSNRHLSYIDLSNNKFAKFPSTLNYLNNLKELHLNINQIKSIPNSISSFSQLKTLNLSLNKISDLPNEISELKQLKYLDLSLNPLDDIPDSVIDFPIEISWDVLSHGINLDNTFIEKPPPEIISKGSIEIKNYLQDSNREVKKNLNEAKIIFVGDGGAGKTSLVKLLDDQPFDINESQTHGIKVEHLKFNIDNEKIKTNIWDFGGQQIMHATHQVFLSKRCIYVLILNARERGNEEYWLKQIQSFGGDSKILIVVNKIDENPSYQVNEQYLKRKYNSIAGFSRISCLRHEGIDEFKNILINVLKDIELIQTNWPLSWFEVKSEIEKRNADYIEFLEYENICNKFEIKTTSKQDTLLGFLNDLGTIVYFDDIRLNDIQVLNPEWITLGIYKIITSDILALNNGLLKIESISTILSSINHVRYPKEKHKYIVELMKKFQRLTLWQVRE